MEVGTWMPALGLALKDDLLPHVTGGFRGRAITVGSLEVLLFKQKIIAYSYSLLDSITHG